MSLKIRLARGGTKKRPFYRVIVAENTAPRDGKFIEKLGYYNPLVEKGDANRLSINEERAKYWLSVGAAATVRVSKFLAELKIIDNFTIAETPKKSAPKKKAQERLAAAAGAL